VTTTRKKESWHPRLRTIEDEHNHLRVALAWMVENHDHPRGATAERHALEYARHMLDVTNPYTRDEDANARYLERLP
jgi:hypothetical protein